jgi:8-oxo-dGTP diphosphatase
VLSRIHVVIGVLVRPSDGHVLVAQRPAQAHQGGLWEFPGGKVESGEAASEALARELREELGIQVLGAGPFMQLEHDYGDRRVLLDVWRVDQYAGEPHGGEGQVVKWAAMAALDGLRFPAANQAVIDQLRRLSPG